MPSLCDNKNFPSWKDEDNDFLSMESKKNHSGIQHTVLLDTMIELMWTTQVQSIVLKEIKEEETHAPRWRIRWKEKEEGYNDAEEQAGDNDSLSLSLSLSLSSEGAGDDSRNLQRSNQETRRKPVRSIRRNLGRHTESGPTFITTTLNHKPILYRPSGIAISHGTVRGPVRNPHS